MYVHLKKGEKCKITVQIHAEEPESFEEQIEVVPRFGETELIKVYAEIQEPVITLSRYSLSYPTIYASKIYQVKSSRDPNAIILRNLGNIDGEFEWEDITHSEVIQCIMEPKKGIIPAKTEILIKFKFMVKLFGKFKFLFRCNVSCLEHPLVFQLDAHIFGLDITYHPFKVDDSVSDAKRKILKKRRNQGTLGSLTSRTISGGLSSSLGKTSAEMSQMMYENSEELNKMEFLSLKINEPYTYKFIIRNKSDIKTNFRLNFDNYGKREIVTSQTVDGENSVNTLGGKSVFNKSFSKAFTITSE